MDGMKIPTLDERTERIYARLFRILLSTKCPIAKQEAELALSGLTFDDFKQQYNRVPGEDK